MSDHIALEAEFVLDSFIALHRAAAIPALIGACVMWSVENGGTDVIKGTLARSITLADEMQAIKKQVSQ